MNGVKMTRFCTREVALKILRNSINVFQQRDTSLIVINVKRDNPDEAADVLMKLLKYTEILD